MKIQHVKEEWIPIIAELRDIIEKHDLFDREKIAVLMILLGNYLINACMTKKDSAQLLGWAMDTYYANIPLSEIGK